MYADNRLYNYSPIDSSEPSTRIVRPDTLKYPDTAFSFVYRLDSPYLLPSPILFYPNGFIYLITQFYPRNAMVLKRTNSLLRLTGYPSEGQFKYG